MVNTTAFGKRIEQIMHYYALPASGFADLMGVGRSSISHILSGRNKPSLDFVMKIIDAYEEVDLHWLLYGQGTFPKPKKVTPPKATIPIETPNQPANDINTAATSAVIKDHQDLFSQSPSTDSSLADSTTVKDPIIAASTDIAKEVEQIVVFYTDGTFKAYTSS